MTAGSPIPVEDSMIYDEELARLAQSGNDDAFTLLRARHLVRVYRICWAILGNTTEAEDATQEAFVKAYLSLRRFDVRRSFAVWINEIARNGCIDRTRHARFQTGWDAEEMVRRPADDPTPEALALTNAEREALRDCLQRLDPQERAVVNGFHQPEEGLRATVIATLTRSLGISRRTIYDRHRRALEKLRRCLFIKGIIEVRSP